MPQGGLPYAGTPEMDALLQQINMNPQMLAVVGQNPALLAEVLKQVGLPVDEQELIDMTADWPDEAAESSMQASLPPNSEATADYEAQPSDEEEEVAADDEEVGPPTGDEPVEDTGEDTMEASAMPRGQQMPTAPMPPTRGGGGNPIDDLISAQMMQRTVGNPNAPVPAGPQLGRQQQPAIPQARMPGRGNPQQQMIAEIFRKQAGAGKKKKKNDA